MIDFESVQDGNIGDAERPAMMPEGAYSAMVSDDITDRKAQTGNIGLIFKFTNLESLEDDFEDEGYSLEGKTISTTFWTSEKALFMLDDFLSALGLGGMDRRAGLREVGGQEVVIIIKHETYNGRTTANVSKVLKTGNADEE